MSAGRAQIQAAIDHLLRIPEQDPLYKPAKFFLGYARLMGGDTEEAQELFAELMEPYNNQANLLFENAKEHWPRTGIRHGLIFGFKSIGRIMVPWVERWKHITILIRGGTFYRMAHDWSEFKARLARFEGANKKGESSLTPKDRIERASFKVYIFGFQEVRSIQNRVKIAAGLTAGDAMEAQETLDRLLSVVAVADLDQKLYLLELELAMAKVGHISGIKIDVPNVEPLQQADIIKYLSLEKDLDTLRGCWATKDWDRCQKLLRGLRDRTRTPDDAQASSLLQEGSFPLTISRHIKFPAWHSGC